VIEHVPNPDALLALGYGLYVVSSRRGDQLNGQTSNTVMQVTDAPPRLAVAVNKGSLTHEFISDSRVLAVTVLAESTPMELIRLFGFKSGRETDKLSQVSYEVGLTGCPVIRDHGLACADVRVEKSLDCVTHTVFVGEVVDSRVLARGRPMTYAYYREVLRGKTPPTAPTYRPPEAAGERHKRKEVSNMQKYECSVCGYIYDPDAGDPDNDIEPGTSFEELPDDWVCPECGAGKDEFFPVN